MCNYYMKNFTHPISVCRKQRKKERKTSSPLLYTPVIYKHVVHPLKEY